MATYIEWAEAFQIFSDYPGSGYDGSVTAEHDEIWAGPNPEDVSDDDHARLEELGWQEHEFGCYHKFV